MKDFIKCSLSIFLALTVCFMASYSVQADEMEPTKKKCSCLKSKKVAVIAPMQHASMDEIINGLKNTLRNSTKMPENYADNNIVTFNGMGDMSNIYSIITQVAQNDEYGVIIPIGTSLTRITMQVTKEKPIISLASIIDENARQKLIKQGQHNITNIQDEIPIETILAFIEKLKLQNILLVYSSDDRVYEQINKIEDIAGKYNINISKFVAAQSMDLHSITNAIKNDTSALVVLKDHLIVNAMELLVQTAHNNDIPIIALDEGSVISGADLAIGVAEKSIGAAGARALEEIVIDKKNIVNMPVAVLSDINVFYNKKNDLIARDIVENSAEQLKYKFLLM